MTEPEYCVYCGEPTGKAGSGDGSLFCVECDNGPYCDECYESRDEIGPCCNPKYL